MAYTLADHARLADSDLKRGVIEIWRRESFVMDLMSFESIDGLSVQAMRTKELPSVGFRKIGGTWTESKGTVEPVQENVYDLGGFVDVDKMIVRSKSVVDERALQTEMFVTALAYEYQDYFINGDPTVDEDGFTGLFYRINNYHTDQQVNGAGLDISSDATGLAANQDTFIDHLQALQHKVDGHRADAFFLNEDAYLRALSALRASGLLDRTQDNYNRWVDSYGPNGPMIYDIGLKADQSTKIIGNTESDDGTAKTGGDATSIYAVKFSKKHLMGIELYSPEVEDIGLLENGVEFRTVIDWPMGIYLVNPRSIAQLHGIVAA